MKIATLRHFAAALLLMTLGSATVAQVQQTTPKPFPYREKLEYRVEWRLITAGIAQVEIAPLGPNWQTRLKLESAGMVTRLYRVDDTYRSMTDAKFCGINSTLEAQEGKRHRLTTLNFDNPKHKLQYEERDLIKNTITSKDTRYRALYARNSGRAGRASRDSSGTRQDHNASRNRRKKDSDGPDRRTERKRH